jgi:hypothetical protein
MPLVPLTNCLAGFAYSITAEFFMVHARGFDVDIDAVKLSIKG